MLLKRLLTSKTVTNFVGSQTQNWVVPVLRNAAGMPGVFIDRGAFLRRAFAGYPEPVIEQAVKYTPQQAGIAMADIDELAEAVIIWESRQAGALSMAAGLPGVVGKVLLEAPDVVQYFAHLMRAEQKLAYLYGWPQMLRTGHDVEEENLSRLVLLMGIMLEVDGVDPSQEGAMDRSAMSATLTTIATRIQEITEKGGFTGGLPVVAGFKSGRKVLKTFRKQARVLKKYLRSHSAPKPVSSTFWADMVAQLHEWARSAEKDAGQAADQATGQAEADEVKSGE